MFKAKILTVGPLESGKTFISNYLSEATESSGQEYKQTQGVRILEFEFEGEEPDTKKYFKVEVELWDCSGNKRFETCWPAYLQGTNGVLLTYNPDKPQQEREIEKWYSYFVKHHGLNDSQCLLIACHKPNSASSKTSELNSPMLAQVQSIHTSFDEDSKRIREAFSVFLANICCDFKETQDQAEQVIVNSQH